MYGFQLALVITYYKCQFLSRMKSKYVGNISFELEWG